jgi:hypothetical protein
MNPLLHVKMRVDAHEITLAAAGQLTAHTAHLLPKVVIGTLRRYEIASLHLNLSAVTTIDYVGVRAIEDCEFETSRRGVLLIVTWEHANQSAEPRARTRERRVNTGAICRRYSH